MFFFNRLKVPVVVRLPCSMLENVAFSFSKASPRNHLQQIPNTRAEYALSGERLHDCTETTAASALDLLKIYPEMLSVTASEL